METDNKLLILLVVVIIAVMLIYGTVFFGTGLGMFIWIGTSFTNIANTIATKLGIISAKVDETESTTSTTSTESKFKTKKRSNFSGMSRQFL
jgi:hypothetical protein